MENIALCEVKIMTLDQVKEFLVEEGVEDAVVFDNPDYADAFVGFTCDGRAVYDYYKMVESLHSGEKMSYDEAREFIDYNTIRALPYMGPKAPIILYSF